MRVGNLFAAGVNDSGKPSCASVVCEPGAMIKMCSSRNGGIVAVLKGLATKRKAHFVISRLVRRLHLSLSAWVNAISMLRVHARCLARLSVLCA